MRGGENVSSRRCDPERITGGGNVSSSDTLNERQWVNRSEDKLFGNVCCVGERSGEKPRSRDAGLTALSWGKAWKSLTSWGPGDHSARTGDELQCEHARLCRCLRSNDSNRNVQFQAWGAMTTLRRSLEGGRTWRLARKAPSPVICG